MNERTARGIVIVIITAIMAIIPSGCGVDYVSDEAKDASDKAERTAQVQEHLTDRVKWRPDRQVKVGDLLKETGTVEYNCHDNIHVTYISNGKGRMTPIYNTQTTCGSHKNYRLVYEKDGSIKSVKITDQSIDD